MNKKVFIKFDDDESDSFKLKHFAFQFMIQTYNDWKNETEGLI
ncbi:MAG: hypothetical protein SFU98_17335 [Leptospiraceae bacterium]|nr:hypothetical protein [Leptospiraceae bacterium]